MSVHPGAESSLVLTETTFELPALAVTLLGKISLHEPSIVAGCRTCGRPAAQRRNDAACTEVSTHQSMMMLGVIAGISQEFAERLEGKTHHHGGAKLDVVGLGTLVG